MKLLFLVFLSSLSFARSNCHEMCKTHSLPYQECVERHCPAISQNWGITCYNKQSQSFQLNIDVIEKLPGGRFNTATYNVEGMILSGPISTGYKLESVMSESRIMTRTHTGYSYILQAKGYGSINLSKVEFSHMPEWVPVGFYGKITLNNQPGDIELSCIKTAFFYLP